MEGTEITNNCKRYWIKSAKLILLPVTRLRKLLCKTNMRQMKIAVGVLIIFSCIATLISYGWYRFEFLKTSKHNEIIQTTEEIVKGTPMRHIPLNEVYKDMNRPNDDEEMFERQRPEMYMIKTTGCKIPLWIVNYRKNLEHNPKSRVKCGRRAVFLRKYDGVTIIALIKSYILRKYMKYKYSDFYCCYQFLLHSRSSKHRDRTVLPNCTKFEDNSKINLQSDFIHIKCFEYTKKNATDLVYQDKFAFTKKLNAPKLQKSNCIIKYNVMMIGLDSMSFYRTAQTLTRTMEYFNNDFWVAYKGYHKIADNTFPNLMAAFTGRNLTNIKRKCEGKMDDCNRHMIWNSFKKAGYVTAYGEDDLELPDTFTNDYKFQNPPTDHYMRPFFIKSEYRMKNSTFLCTGKISSGQQILNYALDFAQTYKKESFFGLFWINSFSHDSSSRPHEADKMIENFFYQLTYTGVLGSTFVIFFSDHGIRFGEQRFTAESYYDERLPMFFIWTPTLFKQQHPLKYKSIVINQFRLVTPYDFYSTLLDIKTISTCSNKTVGPPEGCSNCHTIFKSISPNRTCADVSISDKWCSCHKLYPLPVQDTEGKKSVETAVKHLKSKVKSIITKKCWGCMSLALHKVYRIHFYYHKDKISLFYVVAFSMLPGNVSYEATVLRKSFESEGNIVGPVSLINNYRGLGKCVVNHYDRLFCMCQKAAGC